MTLEYDKNGDTVVVTDELPTHIIMNRPFPWTMEIGVSSCWYLDGIYENIRDSEMRDIYTPMVAHGLPLQPDEYRVTVYICKDKKQTDSPAEIHIRTGVKIGTYPGRHRLFLVYPFEYMDVKRVENETYLTFLDVDMNKVAVMRGGWIRAKDGLYHATEGRVVGAKKGKVDVGGGCFYCNEAVYKKEEGIVYLQCTKYKGKVKETEYDGLTYPAYCKKRGTKGA